MALNSALNSKEGLAAALGFFDGVHRGHAELISRAVDSGYRPLALTFDEHPANIPQITPRNIKTSLIESMRAEAVYLSFRDYRNLTPEDFIKQLVKMNIKFVVCGYNYRFGKGASAGADELKKLCDLYNLTYNIVEPVLYNGITVSSSYIRELLIQGKAEEAADFMNRPFYLEKQVGYGVRLGSRLGFPTINQCFDKEDLIPSAGVYASQTYINGDVLKSVTNIGVNPTVSQNQNTPVAETHIIDYSGDLYGRTVRVALMRKIRDEIKFTSIDDLKIQVSRDILQIINAD